MSDKTIEFNVNCKRCGEPIGYSGMMYDKMKEYGHSRPLYCDECRKQLTLEKMTMGAAYFSVKMLPGTDINEVIQGELGKVYHPPNFHQKVEKEKTFDASKFGATPNKIVEVYQWLNNPKHQVAIVIGGTGSGKSTALPYWLIYPPEGVPPDFFTRDGQILITQPRIVATTSISKYLGTLAGSSVGKGFDIGYRYSKDRNADRFNAAAMVTDGSLINMIEKGQLSDLSVIMIDEAHERSINIDKILFLLKDQLPLYPHLKLLIVSATINRESFLKFFGTHTAAVIEFEEKRKFKYDMFFADEKEKIDYENTSQLKRQLVPALVKKVMCLLEQQAEGKKEVGHILSFLQGVKPIQEAVFAIIKAVEANPKLKDKIEVFPLYSDLTEEESDFALSGKDHSKTRVIVSTNVAEASLTVDGVVYVVDSGVENQAQWKSETLEKRIELELISQANAKQRWGRAGRIRDGEAYGLYTKQQFEKMREYPVPAIQRSSMEEIILSLKKMGIDDLEEGWIDLPPEAELKRSIDSLKKSGAIDDDDMITEYGTLLNQFQYPSTIVDLIILADRFACVTEIATILPVIKSGGFKSLLIRDGNADQQTKNKVDKIHQELMKGCRDDVEFILKLYELYKNTPEFPGGKEEWAKAFCVNFETFKEEIEPERAQLLSLLNAHNHNRNLRQIEFGLLERARIILALCVPYITVKDGKYVFDPKLQMPPGSCVQLQLDIPKVQEDTVVKLKDQIPSPIALARYLIDWEKNAESIDDIRARLLTAPTLPVEDTRLFDYFAKQYQVGQKIMVDVIGYNEHPSDYKILLVVKDPTTSYEAWINPDELCFSRSSQAVKQIPLGTKLNVIIKSIDLEAKTVSLTCLPLLEVELEKVFSTQKKVGGAIVTKAKLIDIRKDNKLVFVAELTKPEEGFVLIVHATDKVTKKPLADFVLGENALVSFYQSTVFDYKANLATDPKISNSLLKYEEGKLIFHGRMKYEQFQELAKLSDDPEYQTAIDYLYVFSNMYWANSVVDSAWEENVKTKYAPDSIVEVTVKTVLSVGAIVSLPDGQNGFIRVPNASDALKFDDKLSAQIIDFDQARQQVNLTINIPENSPQNRLKIGQTAEGTVSNLASYGAFVSFGLGYSGLIHISKLGQRVNHPCDLLQRGDRVKVEILEIKQLNGKTQISLQLLTKLSS